MDYKEFCEKRGIPYNEGKPDKPEVAKQKEGVPSNPRGKKQETKTDEVTETDD